MGNNGSMLNGDLDLSHLDELQVLDKALSQAEIQAIMSQ